MNQLGFVKLDPPEKGYLKFSMTQFFELVFRNTKSLCSGSFSFVLNIKRGNLTW